MGVIKKKPYEISIWEDRLVTENDISYYKEIKLAVIGSDIMESPNRAFDPVLTENVNGEKTLTFSLAFKYHDEYTGEIVQNPFYPYLINERKVKLFYNNEWMEFVIKECEESSTENIFKYTAKELFSLELAKLGYDVSLDTSLNNNQGTVIELAKQVLENTDWEVDEDNSDLLTQYVQEPLYKAVIKLPENEGEEETSATLKVLNLDTNELVSIDNGETIYIFYSYINNKETNYVQFIREADREEFVIDDDNVIKSTNYRITTPIEYVINPETQAVTGLKNIAEIKGSYYNNQGYRLVYKIKTTYDPIMDRTVDVYQAKYDDSVREIYHFLDYSYTTSDVVMSYITNGTDFQLFENGKIQGWYNTTLTSSTDEDKPVLQSMNVVNYPRLDSKNSLTLIENLSELRGFLELKFNGVSDDTYKNAFFNQGFEHSRTLINHVSKGEEFVLRTRYYTSDEPVKKIGGETEGDPERSSLVAGVPNLSADGGLRIVVAKYETIEQECYADDKAKEKTGATPLKVKAYKVLPNEILLDFTDGFVLSPNEISGGVFSDLSGNTSSTERKQYLIDNVVQVPSTAYVYKTEGDNTEYVWDCKNQEYIPKEDTVEAFADYYLTTARAQYSFTNEEMSDPKFKLGIFVYTKDSNLADKYVYLQDIQLTRCFRDGNEQIITLGNVPTAVSNETHNFYLKPTTQKSKEEINVYGSTDFLADELGISRSSITPVFNEQSEKILSIQVSQSNYFNILQELCETFECWLDIRVEHEEDGSIKLDENFNPIKRVAFREYAGKDNFAGFRNGINLEGITRQVDSNEIVTKLIVEPVQSEYSDTGSVAIQQAKSNPSGQSYIINLSYYMNRGLITDIEQCNKDIDEYNKKTKEINQEINDLQIQYDSALMSLDKLIAQRNTYTALIDEAEKKHNEAIVDFQKLTNWEYNEFATEYQNIEEWAKAEENKDKNYLENDTVMDVVGEIYVSSVTLNNYSGILTNLDRSYNDLFLQCYGAKEFNITTSFVPGNGTDINPSTQVLFDDYISGVRFELIDTGDSSVIFQTSPNDKIFKASNALPYATISFLQLPKEYSVQYFEGEEERIITEEDKWRKVNIYDNVTEETYNRHFVLIPSEKFKEEHKGFQERIDELIEQKNEIEKEFYKKYSRFLQEGTWSSQDYIDSELYYFDALQVSDTSSQPKVSYTIDVLEISQIDGFENYDFRVGDKTYIEDPDFFGYLYQATDIREPVEKDEDAPKRKSVGEETEYDEDSGLPIVIAARTPVREEVIVSEIEWHFDEPDNNTITIQNYKTRFEDLFQRVSATVQTVERNEITYPKTTSILDESGLINSSLLSNSLNGIGGTGFALTTNGSVQATQDGLLIRDLLNPPNMMRLASSGLQVTTDGGNTWGTAISAAGISTDILTAGTINTQLIWLMDGDNPSFRWDKSGLNAYGFNPDDDTESYDLKTYVRFDKYGLYGIKNDEEYVASSLEDAVNKAYFSITWKGFAIKNSYEGGGHVEITSEDDFRVFKTITENNNTIEKEKIKIGALEWTDSSGNVTTNPKEGVGAPTLYGIRILNDAGAEVMKTGDDGNLTVSGTINALAGNFSGKVNVGDSDSNHIIIDGDSENPTISSSNYADGAGTGWLIDGNGDATFSNVSVRGAIKTAVFEYEEIQAVGGAFLFRPSSTIKTARVGVVEDGESANDLYVSVDQPLMFKVGSWVKISNYNSMDTNPEAALTTYGLVHIYKIKEIIQPTYDGEDDIRPGDDDDNNTSNGITNDGVTDTVDESESDDSEVLVPPIYEIVLEGGAAILEDVSIENVPGGALIDFGNHKTGTDKQGQTIDVPGDYNYGIGINSSDNYVNLPARAISLFETTIHPNNTTKVTYNYRGILGTLPRLPVSEVDDLIYNQQMAGTQGIYTDNMYLGDASQYLVFYTDENGKKQLKIRANQVMFEAVDPDTHEPTGKYHDVSKIEAEGVPGPAGQDGEDAITVQIDSSAGTVFLNKQITTTLTCTVIQGNGTDITNQVSKFTWVKKNADGTVDTSWSRPLAGNMITLSEADVNSKAIFTCKVEF